MSFKVIIPARYASSRLPGKVLADVHGRPLVQWTWENACRSGAETVVIATDSDRVRAVCEAFGAQVCMTADTHDSGTERLAEVVVQLGWPEEAIVVNVQADEPLLPPQLVEQVAAGLAADSAVPMATLCEPFASMNQVLDPNTVKVVRDCQNHAITFSRAPVPWDRGAGFERGQTQGAPLMAYRRHIGLYAYRAGFLPRYVAWPPCELERLEKLEQLRVLYHGEKILVLDALMDAGIGVDTPDDLAALRAHLRSCG
ncbi:MAG TPA: 3-deoxy-manno-octulosonate cytidylyltransferase [Piscirickettsiaceae bacterium]|nr:3-deoxy-manno-octulosonate cytidylyltransferase [Piscirickettsiaceae bacterium]